jgi:hypothetical protein
MFELVPLNLCTCLEIDVLSGSTVFLYFLCSFRHRVRSSFPHSSSQHLHFNRFNCHLKESLQFSEHLTMKMPILCFLHPASRSLPPYLSSG